MVETHDKINHIQIANGMQVDIKDGSQNEGRILKKKNVFKKMTYFLQ